MLEFACLLHFALTALTAWPGQGGALLTPDVNTHGFIGVMGFSYTMLLHFLVNSSRYGGKTTALRRLLALLSLLLAGGALLVSKFLLTITGTAFLLTSAALFFYFTPTPNRREDLFLTWAVTISLLSWLYFVYALNFTHLWGFETRFSYIMLAFSFPISLLLFSRYVDFLQISPKHVKQTALVLVGGVLSLFAGMLLVWPPLELASAGLLLLLIAWYMLQAHRLREPFLLSAFIGLLLTGLTGVWYLLAYIMGHGQETKVMLSLHAHLAHFSWAIFGIYYLLLRDNGDQHRNLLPALAPLLTSLLLLAVYLLTEHPWLPAAAVILFLVSGLAPARALVKARQHRN
ncbi:hypothetical protein [Desulfurivibrio dismutans]|uniref:hypothetical protein n=1 Tax=Desulfurivibrio dismutans TaxID=1398908 RepID=UPI0023DC4AD1|nr:hypothetical protein [Desulfurivibrio alkaliphilus]MDF1614179.1 hypothetical protein [Desulfurivibrio alkaliphilus]